jgi:secondary thiamine-phosphate synthase enzyme
MFCVGAGSLPELRGSPRLVRHVSTPAPRAYSEELSYHTSRCGEFVDITEDVQAIVARSSVRDGHALVFCAHTTAAIRVNENEPRLLADFRDLLERLVPRGGYRHDEMSKRIGVPPDEPVNGHAHCRQLLLSTSETVPISGGRLCLGAWQRLFLIELCSSRPRQVTVQVLS